MKRIISVLISSAIFFVACAPGTEPGEPSAEEAVTTVAADIDAINAMMEIVEIAYKGGDPAAAIALYADDAVVMIPNQPVIIGKEAIGQAIEAALASSAYLLSLTSEEVQVVGDWAFARGSFSITITPTEGDPVQDEGKFLNLYQRQADNSWKVARHIRNSNKPLPGSEGQ